MYEPLYKGTSFIESNHHNKHKQLVERAIHYTQILVRDDLFEKLSISNWAGPKRKIYSKFFGSH